MTVYVVLIEDRHTDAEIVLFTDREKALAYARETAMDYARDPETPVEEEEIEGWELFLCYSCEGDCIRVEAVEVNE